MHSVSSSNSSTVIAPTRFREAEARGRRLSRGLRLMGRVPAGVDENLMSRIGSALMECDAAGAKLADAIQTRADGRVSIKQLRTALNDGIDAVPDAPQALRDFMEVVSTTPGWVDWRAVDRGAQVFTRLGRTAADVLLQLSLIGGYRFGGPTDLLVATGGLTGDQTLGRLAETQHWTVSLSRPGALRPGNEAWRLTVHVRAMHALVNARFSNNWDSSRFGLPINMADQAGTLGLFDGTLIIGSRALGARLNRRDASDLMHLWKYVGWLLGVDADFLTDDEWERHRINSHLLLAAAAQTPAGPELARASLAAQRQRHYAAWPAGLQRFRGRYEQERMLSMMSVLLGPRSVRELGLAARPPWAIATTTLSNLWWHHVIGRLPGGRTWLFHRGRRISDRIQRSYFKGAQETVADLPG